VRTDEPQEHQFVGTIGSLGDHPDRADEALLSSPTLLAVVIRPSDLPPLAVYVVRLAFPCPEPCRSIL
jgi:hypothetical protein